MGRDIPELDLALDKAGRLDGPFGKVVQPVTGVGTVKPGTAEPPRILPQKRSTPSSGPPVPKLM